MPYTPHPAAVAAAEQTARVFHRDQLDEWGVPHDLVDPADAGEGDAVELHHEQVDTRRWVSVHELVFRAPDDGKAYRVTYERGLTEMQEDHDEWDYRDHVVGEEVEEYERPVKAWRRVGEQPAAVEHCENCGHAPHGHAEHLTNPEALTDCPHCPCAAELREMDGEQPTPAEPYASVTLRPAAAPDELTIEAASTGMDPATVAYGLRMAAAQFEEHARAQGDVDASLVPYHGEHGYPNGEQPEEQQPTAPRVGDRYVKRTAPDAGRTVTVSRVWTADDGHTAVAYEWTDDKPGQSRSACPLDVFHRTYRPEAQQ
jgi:hypothetical protein